MNLSITHRITPQGWLLRLESLAVLAAVLVAYAAYDFSWLWLVLLFLLPDLSALGYLFGPRTGAAAYNVVHIYATPVALAILALLTGWLPGLQLALIWIFHIALDRLLGYGLKYEDGFKDTHLSRV